MANHVGLVRNKYDKESSFSMSNGLTSVFITALTLSGSRLAKTNKEKELVTWIACRDQTFRGGGTVGFHISEMPWSCNGFYEEKQFILYVVIGALQKLGWELLEFTPNKEWAFNCLSMFYELILKFEKDQIDNDEILKWTKMFNEPQYYLPAAFHRCKKHNVFLHWYGCVICNENAGRAVDLDKDDII